MDEFTIKHLTATTIFFVSKIDGLTYGYALFDRKRNRWWGEIHENFFKYYVDGETPETMRRSNFMMKFMEAKDAAVL